MAPALSTVWSPTTQQLSIFGDAANDQAIITSDSAGRILVNGLNISGNPTVSQTKLIQFIGNGGNDLVDMSTVGIPGLLVGNDGNDVLIGGQGNDFIFGEQGNDFIIAHAGNDTIGGGIGDDLIRAGFGDDILDGGEGSDILEGEQGNDQLTGGFGADMLNGGPGTNSTTSSDPGYRTLFVNFDGVSFSHSDLVRYSNGQWFSGSVNELDQDNNGILVQPYLADSTSREDVISGILQHLFEDLRGFRVNVQRHVGAVVEGQKATTLLVGPSTVTASSPHVACDIDVGNDNSTDIAFVGDVNQGALSKTILTASNLALHEAGHTFGLYHVASSIDFEAMSMTYNPSIDVTRDDGQFQNKSYPILPDHGPVGLQNSAGIVGANFAPNLAVGPVRYEGVSPITAMIPYNGGVLTAFTNVGGNPGLNRIHWSSNGQGLGIGPIVYEGVSPVTAMIPYDGGVLTAFTNVSGNSGLNRIHWSANGQGLGSGPIYYEGVSPVTAMTPYNGGVLTAFTNVSGNPGLNRIHWSSNGQGLGSGPVVYEGVSPVTAMTSYNGGVLTAYSNVGGNSGLYRIHWSPNGQNLGSGPIRYEGISPVTAILPHDGGVLTAFMNVGGNPWIKRIHWSADGQNLGSGPIRYEGSAWVRSMIPYDGGLLTAFNNLNGGQSHRIQYTAGSELAAAAPNSAAPRVQNIVINNGDVQRSRVTSVRVDFDSPVVLPAPAADAFKLTRLSDGAGVQLQASVRQEASTSVTLTFAGDLSEFGSLVDGRYQLSINSALIWNANGNLDGNADTVGGDNYVLMSSGTTGLFRLFGDGDGDGAVTSSDFSMFRTVYGLSGPSIFNFNNDGQTGADDFAEFRKRFGMTI